MLNRMARVVILVTVTALSLLVVGAPSALAADQAPIGAAGTPPLASMPAMRSALGAAWPEITDSQRADLRDAWRPLAEDWLAEMSCDSFSSLATAGLVEPTDSHLARYRTCSSTESSADATDEPTEAAAPVSIGPSHAYTPSPTSESPTAAASRASAGLQSSHNMYMSMSNALLENHVGNMNAILNMGPSSSYHYVYSKP